MNHVLLIAVCGATGALLRYGVNEASYRLLGAHFPFSTLIVNVTGCLLLGILSELAAEATLSVGTHKAIGVGLLGALTTFSAFGHETFRRMENSQWLLAGGNVAANLCLGLLAVWLGVVLVRRF